MLLVCKLSKVQVIVLCLSDFLLFLAVLWNIFAIFVGNNLYTERHMTIDKDEIVKQLQELVKDAKVPECPAFFEDERLEDAFKTPICNEEGYSELIPAIWNDVSYEKDEDGTLFITLKNAYISSNLYSKYLDEEALVLDSLKNRLLLYVPDPEESRMAFKGSRWQFAKRLKPECKDFITLRDVYCEIMEKETINDTCTE